MESRLGTLLASLAVLAAFAGGAMSQDPPPAGKKDRPRARDAGLVVGVLPDTLETAAMDGHLCADVGRRDAEAVGGVRGQRAARGDGNSAPAVGGRALVDRLRVPRGVTPRASAPLRVSAASPVTIPGAQQD